MVVQVRVDSGGSRSHGGRDLFQITASLGPLGAWPWVYLSEFSEGPEGEGLFGLPSVCHLTLSGPLLWKESRPSTLGLTPSPFLNSESSSLSVWGAGALLPQGAIRRC